MDADEGAGKKGKKEKKKKEKKEKKEKAPKVKKEKPPKEIDRTPPLPKKPDILILIMALSILIDFTGKLQFAVWTGHAAGKG